MKLFFQTNSNSQKFDLAFDVDPLFKKTSAAFDEGGAKGLLLNHLSVFNNCQIIFDSSDAITDADSLDPSLTCTITDLSSIFIFSRQNLILFLRKSIYISR